MNLVVSATGGQAHALTSAGHDASEDGTGRGTPIVANALVKRYGKGTDSDATDAMVVSTLQSHKTGGYRIDAEGAAGGHLIPATAFHATQTPVTGIVSPTLGKTSIIGAMQGPLVRRLTPIECERLMSWPDNWTAIDGDRTPDSRRYAACGDGVVSNVAEWIGRRIVAVDQEITSPKETR